MDKKDVKGYVILLTKIYLIMVLGMGSLGNLIAAFFYSIGNGGGFFSHFWMNTKAMLGAFLYLTLLIYGGIAAVYFLSKLKRKNDMIYNDAYIRDLPEYFPPAIASYLLDLSLETTDYTATIAYLMSKGYIELEGDKAILRKDSILDLSQHERYALQAVLKNVKFNYEDFKKYIIADAEKMGYIKRGARSTHFLRNFFCDIAICFTTMMFAESVKIAFIKTILEIIGFITGIGMFVIIGYTIFLLSKYTNESYHRTELGEVEAKKWTGVKNYLKDYTMISERDLKDTVLFDDYIPYAISLNEAKNIEKYIENNEAYRKLIYGNVYTFYKEQEGDV